MQLAHYLELVRGGLADLAEAYRDVAAAHQAEVDVFYTCEKLARQAEEQAAILGSYRERYQPLAPASAQLSAEPSARFRGPREPGIGLLRDLQELYLMASECDLCMLLIDRAAQGARDRELLADLRRCHEQTRTQVAWLRTQLSNAAVQALVVA